MDGVSLAEYIFKRLRNMQDQIGEQMTGGAIKNMEEYRFLMGELTAYNVHLKTLSPKAWPALFTEVVGQVCTFYALGGEFGPQKIALLPQFDYEYLGALTPEGEAQFGYKLDRKRKILVPIDSQND